MTRPGSTRRAALGRVLAAGLAAATVIAVAARAEGNADWNGTWVGGWDKGAGVQLTFAGNTFISLFWRGDYLHDPKAEPTADSKGVRIVWDANEALLTRTGERTARLVVRERGRPDVAVDLKRE